MNITDLRIIVLLHYLCIRAIIKRNLQLRVQVLE